MVGVAVLNARTRFLHPTAEVKWGMKNKEQVKLAIPHFSRTDDSGLWGRNTNPVGGFAEEDFRGTETPGDAQKVEGTTFCKANRNCVKAPIIRSIQEFTQKNGGLPG
jgi:hypothetical protein